MDKKRTTKKRHLKEFILLTIASIIFFSVCLINLKYVGQSDDEVGPGLWRIGKVNLLVSIKKFILNSHIFGL